MSHITKPRTHTRSVAQARHPHGTPVGGQFAADPHANVSAPVALTGVTGDETGLVSDETLQMEVDSHPDLPANGVTFLVENGRYEAVYEDTGEYVFPKRLRHRRPGDTTLEGAMEFALDTYPRLRRVADRTIARRKRRMEQATVCRQCSAHMTQEVDAETGSIVTHCDNCGWEDHMAAA